MRVIRLNKSGFTALVKYGVIKEQSNLDEYGRKGTWKSEWKYDDQILAMYNSRYGIEDLGFNKQEVAEDIIGSSVASFNKQTSNFNFLDGKGGLDRESYKQKGVHEQFVKFYKNLLKPMKIY